MKNTILTLQDVSYAYKDGSSQRVILDDLSYSFEKGVFYTIMGESGSGKTTLLSLIGGLEKTQQGTIFYQTDDITKVGLERYRQKNRTMIFQNFNLISYLTALENVLNGMMICHIKPDKEKALEALESVGIDREKAKRSIKKLSGGEQQRVAIARSLAIDVELILADEPTGNLDKQNETQIINLFRKLAHEKQRCVIVVTHSQSVAQRSDIILGIEDGKLYVKKNRIS